MSSNTDEAFNAANLKLVSKVFPNLLVNKIASVQPMLGPTALIYYSSHFIDENNENPLVNISVASESTVARTRQLETCFEHGCYTDANLDILAASVIKELNVEHLTDLMINAGTVGKCVAKNGEDVYDKMCEMSDTIYRKTLRGNANFFVMTQKVYDKYKNYIDCFHKEVYCPDGWESPDILMGYRGESYLDSGYHYNPYVPFTRTPTVSGTTCGLFHRYGKKLVYKGSDYYARLEIENDE